MTKERLDKMLAQAAESIKDSFDLFGRLFFGAVILPHFFLFV